MTPSQVIDVASVLSHLRRLHGIETDPALGPLLVADFRFIAECIEQDWNTYNIATELADRLRGRAEDHGDPPVYAGRVG